VDVRIRDATSAADKARSLEIFNAVEPDEAVSAEDVARFEAMADASADFLASIDGRDIGSAVCAIQPQHPDAAFTLVDVVPEARRRGIGQALYERCSAFARAHGREALLTRVDAADEESLGFARRRGFADQQRDDWLELDLATATQRFEPPSGVGLVWLGDRPELAGGAYDVACESLPDIPGEDDWTPPPRAQWIASLPECTLVATAGDEVVGYAILRIHADVAKHGMTAVKRAWRGRGVARALKSAQIEWARANGIARLRTANEQRNEPIRALNARFGYVPVGGRIVLVGPLSDAT
jgi:mycothiol synthase